MTYDGLCRTHSDQEADGFIALAAGHIDGAARYLAEYGPMTHGIGAVDSIAKLNIDPDPETAASKVYAAICQIFWTCQVVSGRGTANNIAETILSAVVFFLRLNGGAERAREIVAEVLGEGRQVRS